MKLKIAFLLLLLLPGMPTITLSQKVKYKDLYLLLNAKKYDDAQPFLYTFLTQKPDFPNAHYQLGLLYEYKAYNTDILQAQDTLNQYVDSARQYFASALTLITEKEVKKRDEYYQQFNRRDLRTGKFGIKLADVHDDIKDRDVQLMNYADTVQQLNDLFTGFTHHYDSASAQYNALLNQYPSYSAMVLGYDSLLGRQWLKVASQYQAYQTLLAQYSAMLKGVPKTSYNQQPQPEALQGLAPLPNATPDFYSNAPAVANFEAWATACQQEVNNVLLPLREQLITFDKALDQNMAKAGVDSTLTQYTINPNGGMVNGLQQYDEAPALLKLFAFKNALLNTVCNASKVHNKALADSALIDTQIALHQSLLAKVNAADSLLGEFQNCLNAEAYRQYAWFINQRHGGKQGLTTYIEQQQQRLQRQKATLQQGLAGYVEASLWAVTQQDSIPMWLPADTATHAALKYHTKHISQDDSLYYLAGLIQNTGQAAPTHGFFTRVTENRLVAQLDTFAIQHLLPQYAIDSLMVFTIQDEQGAPTVLVYRELDEALLTEMPDSLLTKGICLRYDTAGLLTDQVEFSLDDAPVKVEVDTNTRLTSIYYINSKQANAGQLQRLVINQEGKIEEEKQ